MTRRTPYRPCSSCDGLSLLLRLVCVGCGGPILRPRRAPKPASTCRLMPDVKSTSSAYTHPLRDGLREARGRFARHGTERARVSDPPPTPQRGSSSSTEMKSPRGRMIQIALLASGDTSMVLGPRVPAARPSRRATGSTSKCASRRRATRPASATAGLLSTRLTELEPGPWRNRFAKATCSKALPKGPCSSTRRLTSPRAIPRRRRCAAASSAAAVCARSRARSGLIGNSRHQSVRVSQEYCQFDQPTLPTRTSRRPEASGVATPKTDEYIEKAEVAPRATKKTSVAT